MNSVDLNKMRRDITALIDDIKYQSDNLTDLERLPVIQLKVLLAKICQLNQETTILMHCIEVQGRHIDNKATVESQESEIIEVEEKSEQVEPEVIPATESKPETAPTQEPEPVAPKATTSKKEFVEDKLKKIAVKDLMMAIGINEKYLYASELFKGNISLFTSAVQEINQMNDIQSVRSRLEELSKEYNWDPENEWVINFNSLIERKFSLT